MVSDKVPHASFLLQIWDFNQKSFATTDTDHRVPVAVVQVHLRPAQDRVVPRLPRDLVRLHRIRGRNCRKQVRNIVSVCSSVCPPIHGTVCPQIHGTVCPQIHGTVCLTLACLSICPYFSLPHSCLSLCLFVCPYVHANVCLSFVCSSVCPSVHPFVRTSVCLTLVYPSVCPSICPIHTFILLPVSCLSIWLSVHSYFQTSLYLHVCLSDFLFIRTTITLTICPSVRLPIKFLFIQTIICCTIDQLACSSVCHSIKCLCVLSICPSVCLTINLTVWSFVCLSECLSTCLSTIYLECPFVHLNEHT